MTPTLTSPPRAKVARSGKLRPITRAQASAFNAAVLALMIDQPIHADLRSSGTDPFIAWRVSGLKVAPVLVALYLRQVDLFTVLVHVPPGRVPGAGVHPYSGAWHVAKGQAEDALAELRSKLDRCGVVAIP